MNPVGKYKKWIEYLKKPSDEYSETWTGEWTFISIDLRRLKTIKNQGQ